MVRCTGRPAYGNREATLATREAALLAREAAAAADERRRAAEAAIARHVEAGRVLPAERAALVALLAALGNGQDNDDEGAEGGNTTISDEAEESTTRRVENPPVQHVVRVGVSVMVAAPNDRGGGRGRGRLSALLAQARQALAGWAPPGQREVLSFRRGRLVSLEDGRLQWLDEYEIRRIARAGVVEAA